ncbi:MAG: prepilin-type N-terminal cleavage/methylation domain-containing protein [Patescibacteria group bacterium]
MKNAKGFTLVELIIYIGILSVMVVGLVSFALSMTSARTKTYTNQNVQANARMTLDIIMQKIRTAQSVNIGVSVFGIDPGVLSLQMADPLKNPTIINLSANDGRLQITEGVGVPIYLTDNETEVSNLLFTNLTQSGEREHIKIDLMVRYVNAASVDYSYSWSGSSAASVRQ